MTEANTNNGGVAQADTDVIVYLDPAEVGRSPFNREIFDDAEMEEMIQSVRAHGILQPVLVRENPGYCPIWADAEQDIWKIITMVEQTTVVGNLPGIMAKNRAEDLMKPRYEIIAGERRWRAATAAGIPLKAIIRNMTDEDTVTLQGVENMKRKNLSPMDEAQKCRQLRDIYKAKGMKAKEAVLAVAEAFNTSKTVVYERLALFDLDDKMQAEVRSGVVSPTHAGLLLRIEDPVTRAAALKQMKDCADDGEEIVGTREAEDMVAAVVAKAEKEKAWFAAVEEAEANGWEVLKEKETPHIYTPIQVFGDFVSLLGTCPYLAGEPEAEMIPVTWEEALGKHAPNRVLAKMRTGGVVYLYRKEEAIEALKLTDHKLDFPKKKTAEAVQEEEAERMKAQAAQARRESLHRSFAIDAFVEAKNCEGPGAWKVVWEFLHLHGVLLEYTSAETLTKILEDHGVKVDPEGDLEFQFLEYGRSLDGKRLRGLVVQCLLFTVPWFQCFSVEGGGTERNWNSLFNKITEFLPGVTLPAWNEEDEKPKEEVKPVKQKAAKDTKGKAKAKASPQKKAKEAKAPPPAPAKGKKGGGK